MKLKYAFFWRSRAISYCYLLLLPDWLQLVLTRHHERLCKNVSQYSLKINPVELFKSELAHIYNMKSHILASPREKKALKTLDN